MSSDDDFLTAAPSNTALPIRAFGDKLVVIVPHNPNIESTYPKQVKNKKTGEIKEVPKFQTLSTVFPLEDGEFKDKEGKLTKWEAGDSFRVYIASDRIRDAVSEVNRPVVGRVAQGKPKGGFQPPWLLKPPTKEEMEQAKSLEGLKDKVDEAVAKAKEFAEARSEDNDEDTEDGETPF